MSTIHFVQLDYTLDNSIFDELILPLVKKYRGESLGGISKWSLVCDESSKDSDSLKVYPTYKFPDEGKKDTFVACVRKIDGISIIKY